jgi:uncharacterized protein YjeT (DUF2065 family)|tara:strand:- start:844 stop:1032 length:189 start_codon:yes stop_codon:yes gene_type:complete
VLTALLVGVGVALALEGAAYALAPEAMKRFLSQIMEIPGDQLRIAGLVALVSGVVLVAFLGP